MSPQTPANPISQDTGKMGVLASYSGPLPPAVELEHYDTTSQYKRLNFIGNITGQIFSAVICLSALALCGYLAMNNHTWEAVAVVAIPFAGIIRAMRSSGK